MWGVDDDEWEGWPVTIQDVDAVKETEKAILIYHDGMEAWIPKSQIHEDSEVYAEGHSGDLVIPKWLAKQKGLV